MAYVQYVTSASKNFVTSAAKNFKVFDSQDNLYYDSIGLVDSTLTSGTITTGNFTANGGATNTSATISQNTGHYATFSQSTSAGIRFDLTTAKTINFALVYLSGGLSGHTIKIFGSDTAGSSYSELASYTTLIQGWNNITVSGTNIYYVLQIEKGTVGMQVNEVIMGESLLPDPRHDLQNKVASTPIVSIKESYSGVEYTNQMGVTKDSWDLSWLNINSTLKTTLEAVRDNSEMKGSKLCYFDSSVYNYVSLDGLTFTEIASGRFSTSLRMIT